jgi:hypothetical protein
MDVIFSISVKTRGKSKGGTRFNFIFHLRHSLRDARNNVHSCLVTQGVGRSVGTKESKLMGLLSQVWVSQLGFSMIDWVATGISSWQSWRCELAVHVAA